MAGVAGRRRTHAGSGAGSHTGASRAWHAAASAHADSGAVTLTCAASAGPGTESRADTGA